jgi:hypothetical protein
MYEHGSLPRARQEGLLEETVGEELLLYDQKRHTAHCLSPVAAYVWRHCDGEHGIAALARLAGVSEGTVTGALQELREKDLLVAGPALMQNTSPGESRREAIGRATRYGAAAVAGSMVISATAATPAMAASSKCCQCVDASGKNCACTTVTSDAECTQFCEKSAKCTQPATGTLAAGKCENGVTCA